MEKSDCIKQAVSVCLMGNPHARPQLNDRPKEILSQGKCAMTGTHQWEANAVVRSGGRNRFWGERQITRRLFSERGEIIEMIIALYLEIVDLLAGNQHPPA